MAKHSLSPKPGAERREVSATEAARPVGRQLLKRPDLGESEHELIKLMGDLNFGRIERLRFRDGKPILQPLPRIIAAVKMTSENRKADSKIRTGTCLKQSLTDLFALMQRVGEGELLTIDVRHGLPFSVEIEWLGNR